MRSSPKTELDAVRRSPRTHRWAGRLACAWAVIFALMSLYWAAGGLIGGETLGVEIDRLAHQRAASLLAELWAAFALKALAAVLALALVEPWGRRVPRPLLLLLGWATGAGITVYAVACLVQHALMATGAIRTPDTLGTHALPWHLWLWDPFWLAGGLLFVAAAHGLQRSPRAVSARPQPRPSWRPAGSAARQRARTARHGRTRQRLSDETKGHVDGGRNHRQSADCAC
jgi:hypothetical protein